MKNMTSEPSKDDITNARYYIGLNKPKPQVVPEPDDPWLYRRLQEARKRGVTMDELEDEPDNLPDSPEQAGWDDIND